VIKSFLAFMAYASKRRLDCKTCYRMHQNALFRMEKVKKKFLGRGTAPQTPPHWGGGYPLLRPHPPRRLRHLDSRAFGTRPPYYAQFPLRDLGWRRPCSYSLSSEVSRNVIEFTCILLIQSFGGWEFASDPAD